METTLELLARKCAEVPADAVALLRAAGFHGPIMGQGDAGPEFSRPLNDANGNAECIMYVDTDSWYWGHPDFDQIPDSPRWLAFFSYEDGPSYATVGEAIAHFMAFNLETE